MGKHAKNELMYPTDSVTYKDYWHIFGNPKPKHKRDKGKK